MLMPVNSMPRLRLSNGFTRKADNGILKVATSKMARRPLLHLAKMPLPARQMPVQITSTMVAHRYSHQKLSGSH